MEATLLVLAAYLIGSVPSAYVAGRVLKGVDIRMLGDGNVGAANASRQLGVWAGVAVLVADALKGLVAIALSLSLASQTVAMAAGFAVVAGHNWPLYIGFKGGRGEAAAIGVLSALLPREMVVLLAICAAPFLATRNTMLAGAILFAPLWLVSIFFGEPAGLIVYSAALPCLVGIRHVMTTRRLPADVRKAGAHMGR